VVAQGNVINSAIIANIASMNSNIATANAAVVSFVNTQNNIINNAIISNIATVNANLVTANNAVVAYVNTQITNTNNAWIANAQAQDAQFVATRANIANTYVLLGGMTANITTLQTEIYANANVAAYLPTYNGNIYPGNITASGAIIGGNINVGNAIIGNATIGNISVSNITTSNLSVSGQYNGAIQTVRLAAVTTAPSAIFTSPTYCNFCLVTGNDGLGNYFSDVVLMSQGTTTVNVISSLAANGTPSARTYSATSANLRCSVTSGTYTVKTVAISL